MVTHCVCHNVAFQTVAELAQRGLSLEQISAATGCCTGCGTCRPYVRVVIATGATRLPVLSEAQADAVIAQAAGWPRSKRPGPDRQSPGTADTNPAQ